MGNVYVGVHSDKDATSYKRAPIINYTDRCFQVESCKYVTGVIYNTELEITKDFIEANGIDIVACSKYDEKYHKDPQELGILLIMGNARDDVSTTDIIKNIKNNNIQNNDQLFKRYLTVWNRKKVIKGKEIEFDVVGRAGPYPNCVCIFPYNTTTDCIYLIKEYHQGVDELKYGLPGGYYEIKKHKDINDAARAELSEECHLRDGKLINLLSKGYSELKWVTNQVVPFICIDPVEEITSLECDPEEDIEIVKVNWDELMEIIRNGDMTPTSVYATLLAVEYIEDSCFIQQKEI
jgi:glycerol-3-phosphate cytidylyltransferase-like family protein/ADP-ribose pyrophosphatase YjhB (NUDIX family)